MESIDQLDEEVDDKRYDEFVVLDFEHELIEEIVELSFSKPEFNPQADDVKHKSQRLGFGLFFILADLIDDKAIVTVVALPQVVRVGLDLVRNLDQYLFEPGEDLDAFDRVLHGSVKVQKLNFIKVEC